MKYLRFIVWILLFQNGLTESATAQSDPARWEEAMLAFDAMDAIRPPPANAIVLTGSSSIARWNDQAAAALAPLTIIPRGFGGSTMEDLLFHLERVALRYQPRAILIYEGDNDTASKVPVFAILNQFREVLARIHDTLPETRIYILAVKPSILRAEIWDMAQRVNAGYRGIAAQDPLVHYIDTATPFLKTDGTVMDDIFIEDNLHFNDLGNLIWGATIRAGLMPVEARHEPSFNSTPARTLPTAGSMETGPQEMPEVLPEITPAQESDLPTTTIKEPDYLF